MHFADGTMNLFTYFCIPLLRSLSAHLKIIHYLGESKTQRSMNADRKKMSECHMGQLWQETANIVLKALLICFKEHVALVILCLVYDTRGSGSHCPAQSCC